MTRKSTDPHKALLLEYFLGAGENRIPDELSKALASQAKPGGESIFTTAIAEATPDQVERARSVTGTLDTHGYVKLYQKTNNPLWLWMSVFGSAKPEDIPSEAFAYLRRVGKDFFILLMEQISTLERVQIKPGREFQEGVERTSKAGPPPPDIAYILGLSKPGQNLFQAAARDLRSVSFTAAVKVLVRETGCSLENAYTALALATGRVSPETGPSTEAIRKFVHKGKKLMVRQPMKTAR